MVVVLHIGAWTALFCLFHWYRNVITSQLREFSCSQAQSKYSCNSHQHLCTVLIIGGDLPIKCLAWVDTHFSWVAAFL